MKETTEVSNSTDRLADERVLSTAPEKDAVSDRTFKKWKKRLNPFATSLALMHKEIEDKSTAELKYLIKYGHKLTNTNCWWAELHVFPLLKSIVTEELNRRQYQKRRGR